MSLRIPFTTVIHSPSKPEIVLANGKQFIVINTSTGEVVKPINENERKQEYSELYRIMTFNNDGSLLATTGDDKKINVYDTSDWSLKLSRVAHKRINSFQFNHASTEIIIADKFGDVYAHPNKNQEDQKEAEKLEPIVGHVSMVTDMTLSKDEKFIVTSDRDEHIRVSRYPNGYNIETFCLGHKDVVTYIQLLPWNEGLLISAGGDNTVRVWDFLKGKEIQSLNIKEYIQPYMAKATDANSEEPMVRKLAIDASKNLIAVVFAKTNAVVLLEWTSDNTLTYKSTLETESTVLDATFDLQNRLWVTLAPTEEKGDLLAIFEEKNGKYEHLSSKEQHVKQVNSIETGLVEKMPDLYTIFGLRKLLDLPDFVQTPPDKARNKNKKRKVEETK
ncbi:WD40-repeat-containing domain protein [Phascolomyces articulosus]|uniref:WD40-repeat-containing domain protein n=1 Tax=Phascolomyces articulosus TaxID=60185 RepID=A0AAD5JNY8_9FUNG|nr:WD40-repeat-containing domain protein [Phascolomyces articulosus]